MGADDHETKGTTAVPFPDRSRLSRRDLLRASLAATTTAAPPLGRPARSAFAAPATPICGGSTARFDELGALAPARMAELKIPGVALGVIVDGEEHTAGFGFTSMDHPLPVDADTLFPIGSTTKTYTGTAMMRLVEAGTLDLEAPVRAYLPDFRVADAGASREVRLRHLVTHTAGWVGDFEQETGDGDDALARSVVAM